MYRSVNETSQSNDRMSAVLEGSAFPVNAIGGVDGFVTAEPTPKPESRRGWRRRRIRRGKS